MGGVTSNKAVFISYASDLPPPVFPEWMRRYVVKFEVKKAVFELRLSGPSPQVVERCLAAFRQLQDLSDEDSDALEPELDEEIWVLHHLCAADKDLQ